jgi:putative membrane protein
MGVAEAIPGVNGATIAILLRVYTRIIDAIKRLEMRQIFGFLMPIGIGTLIAIWVLSGIIPPLMTQFPNQANALIFGIVAVSVYIPWSQVDHVKGRHIVTMLIFALAAFAIVGLPFAEQGHSGILLFIYGAIGACALLLPGLSGSYLLKVFGQYEYILTNLHRAFALDTSSIVVIAIFALGMATGALLFARLLSWLLHHHNDWVMAAMAGLTLGALRSVWPEGAVSWSNETPIIWGCILLGAGVMICLIVAEKRAERS